MHLYQKQSVVLVLSNCVYIVKHSSAKFSFNNFNFNRFLCNIWLHLTGEMDKSVRFSCSIFSGFNMPKIIKIGYFLQSYSKNKKVDVFLRHSVDLFAFL